MAKTKLRSRGPKPGTLTNLERAFVEEYKKDGDGTRAILAAGSKCKTRKAASVLACVMLKRPRVAAAVGYLFNEERKRRTIEADTVLEHVADCATRDARLLFDANGILVLNHRIGPDGTVVGSTIHNLPEKVTNAIDSVKQRRRIITLINGTVIEEVETELKLVSKAAALDMAMKHKGLFAAEKSDQRVLHVSWEELAGEESPDKVEGRLQELKEKELSDE